MKRLKDEKMIEWRTWFDNRLDNAIEAAEVQNAQTDNESTCTEHLGIQNDFNFFLKFANVSGKQRHIKNSLKFIEGNIKTFH